jgi:CRISPR-associated exonuclease Cas4
VGWLIVIALVLGAVGLWLLRWTTLARQASGLPTGRITYVDMDPGDRCERPLFSQRFRLTGRPDYLVQSRQGVIPVEVKSGAAPVQPYEAHVLQLAAYCLLVEEQEGTAPSHGILKYEDRAFEIDYTPQLRARLIEMLDSIRAGLQGRGVGRSHQDAGRCRGCGYRDRCEERLA